MRAVFWRGNAKKLSFWFTLICSPPFLESFAHEFFLNKTSWFCCPQKVVKEKFLHFAEVDKTMRFAEATMSEFFLLHKVGFFASYQEMGCNANGKASKSGSSTLLSERSGWCWRRARRHIANIWKTCPPPVHQVHSHTLKSISGYLFLNVLFLFLRERERNMYFAASSV